MIGAVLVAAPSKGAQGWIGPEADLPTTQVATRALGIRDLAIGLGTLAAANGVGDVRPWLIAGIACDTVDLGATVAAGASLPPTGRYAVPVIAAAGALTGAALLRALR